MIKLEKVCKKFQEYFASWKIVLPENVGKKGTIKEAGWFINYAITEKGFEFYCGHRMTNSRYHLITEDGTISQPAEYQVWEGRAVGNTPEEEEKSEKEYQAHNKAAYEYYKSVGLDPE